MTIRDNLVRTALRTGIALDIARGEHKAARKRLTADERWAVDIATSEAMIRWYRGGMPEGGPEQFLEEALAEAEAHVSSRRQGRTEPER